MRLSRDDILRFTIGPLLSAFVAIVILRIGDNYSIYGPYGQPSLITVPTAVVFIVFPWFFAASAAAGFISALAATLGTATRNAKQGFTLTALSFVVICLVQTFVIQGSLWPLTTYFLGVFVRLIYLTIVGCFGAFFGIIIGTILSNLFAPRRSALGIMPDELRERVEKEQAAQRAKTLPVRLRQLFSHSKS